MKLKHMLILAFLILTLIPTALIALLLYKSSYALSEASYTRNLKESISVQTDDIAQAIEENMISDYRFANENLSSVSDTSVQAEKDTLLTTVQSYLKASEDKITISLLLDKNNKPVYSIGENATLSTIKKQLPDLSKVPGQEIMEFQLEKDSYSLGIVTPVKKDGIYTGSLISIYDKSYIFKIISSYYKISDTSTFICRENGKIIRLDALSNHDQVNAVENALGPVSFSSQGSLAIKMGDNPASGYYKKISNTPWYLAGFVGDKLIASFANQFILIYILIISGILIADILLAIYFSKRVVRPINNLITLMDQYQSNLNDTEVEDHDKGGYFETKYLKSKFIDLMHKILLAQHNYEGIFQLYQSSNMDDTNIEIDVKDQTISSNKALFQTLMDGLDLPEEACIIERFTHCFSDTDRDMLTKMFEEMRDEHLSVPSEIEVSTPHFDQRWYHILVVPMYDGERLSRLFIQLRDVSNFKKQELLSNEQAKRDVLTGLYNRMGFSQCVGQIMESENHSGLHGLLFIDMDYFKLVNDNLGHSTGDELLCTVANTLLEVVDSGNVVSRFGGDEFVIFLPYTTEPAVNKLRSQLNKQLVYPYHTSSASFVVSASIGVTMWDASTADTFENLLQKADASMYQAKKQFKHNSPH